MTATAIDAAVGSRRAATRGWLLAPAPPERLAAFRILVAAYALVWLAVRWPHLAGFADADRFGPDRFDPVGPLGWLEVPLGPGVWHVLVAVAIGCSALVVVGWRHVITGPLFGVSLLAVTTYRNSWGTVLHTDNLVALHALVVAIAPATAAWSLDARRRRSRAGHHARPTAWAAFGWPLRVAAVVTVLAYVVAGWAKVSTDLFGWLDGEVLRNQIAFDNVRKELVGDVSSPLGGWAVQHGWLFPPMGVLTLAVELGAPFALINGRLARWWSGAAWTFHLGIVALMAILFPYPLAGIAFAPFFRLERLPAIRTGLTRRPAPPPSAPASGARQRRS